MSEQKAELPIDETAIESLERPRWYAMPGNFKKSGPGPGYYCTVLPEVRLSVLRLEKPDCWRAKIVEGGNNEGAEYKEIRRLNVFEVQADAWRWAVATLKRQDSGAEGFAQVYF